MASPMIISSLFVLAVVVLCLLKPNAGRIFLGLFFLAMALGVNGSFTFGNPQAYLDYANGTLIPFYRLLAIRVVTISPVIFGILLMVFEISMGFLLLHKKQAVRVGLIGTMIFIIGIAPMSWMQIPWLGLLVGQGFLLTKDFDQSVLEKILFRMKILRS